MAIPVITIYLESSNTDIAKEPVIYNMEIEVNLTELWDEIISLPIQYTRVQIQTYVSIPIIKNSSLIDVNVSLINYFNVKEIVDKKVIQYGYFEGTYDESRKITSSAKIWLYEMIPYAKEGE